MRFPLTQQQTTNSERIMKNLNTKNKVIFCITFVTMNIFCTWLVLEVGAIL